MSYFEKQERRLEENAVRNWNMHHAIKTDSLKAIDNILLIASPGSFAVSLAFLAFIKSGIQHVYFLIASWALLGASLVCLMLAHYFNAKYSLTMQHRINKQLKDGQLDKYTMARIETDSENEKNNRWASQLRFTAMAFFIVGLITLFMFATGNMLANSSQRSDHGHFNQEHPFR